jgi:hypothetical protein
MPSRRQMAAALSQDKPSDGRSRNGGRNGSDPVYTEALAEEICDRLATGEPLNVICRDAHMPSEKAVRKWADSRPEFGPAYARARDFGYDSIAEGILELGAMREAVSGPDGYVDNGEVQRLRLLSENRKWLLGKMRPKQYGDKVTQEITGEDGGALITRIELVPVDVRPRQIEHDDGSVDGSRPSKRRKR